MNFNQVLLSFILQCQKYPTTAVNSKWHNTLKYIPQKYHGLKVTPRISSQGNTRFLVPYIAFLGNKHTVTGGYYPVFLYYREHETLILSYGLGTKHTGGGWDFAKLGIATPKTIKDLLGTSLRKEGDKRYNASYVYKAYNLKGVVGHFKGIDVTDDSIYQAEAVTKYGFESRFDFDTDIRDICNQYLSLLGLPGIPSVGTSGPGAGGAPTSTPPVGPDPAVEHPRNIILYGPPGTGKTYNSIRYAVAIAEGIDVSTIVKDSYTDRWHVVKNAISTFKSLSEPPSGIDPRIVFTTFHQSLSYEDFIEGIKPKINEDKKSKKKTVYYEKEPGLFKRICDAARGKKENYVLIIDEINRGNVAQIFGELITLIEEDKREGAKNEIRSTLPYSRERFCVPDNLYIIGTMNTADRSVEALDTALRRRFKFIEMMPNCKLVPSVARSQEVFTAINQRISILKDTEHQIGHSYFKDVATELDLCKVFRQNIIPLLQEYFFGDMERIRMVLGKDFVKEEPIVQTSLFPNYNGDIDIPTSMLRLWTAEEWDNCEKDIVSSTTSGTTSGTTSEFSKAIDSLLNG